MISTNKYIVILLLLTSITIHGMEPQESKDDYNPQEILFDVCEGKFKQDCVVYGVPESFLVKYLINQKASLSAKNSTGKTAFTVAITKKASKEIKNTLILLRIQENKENQ